MRKKVPNNNNKTKTKTVISAKESDGQFSMHRN